MREFERETIGDVVAIVSPERAVAKMLMAAGWPSHLPSLDRGEMEFVSDAHIRAYDLAWALYWMWAKAMRKNIDRAARYTAEEAVLPERDMSYRRIKRLVGMRDGFVSRLARRHLPSFAEYGQAA